MSLDRGAALWVPSHLSRLRRRAAERFKSRTPDRPVVDGRFGMSLSIDPDDREARAATNHALFREVNERVRELNEGFSL